MEFIPHLIRPLWLGLPLVLTIVWLWHQRLGQRSSLWSDHVDLALRQHVLEKSTSVAKSDWAPLLPIWVCGLAAAGPSWQQVPQDLYLDDDPLFIALDLSQSMLASDLVPNRLERAKFKLTDLLSTREGGLTALVVYTSAAFVVTPLTNDTKTIQQQLSVLTPKLMPTQGTRFLEAYALCASLLEQSGHQQGKLLLIGDDLDDVSVAELSQAGSARPLKLLMLGVGTAEGAPVPELTEPKQTQGPLIARVDHRRLSEQLASLGGEYVSLTDGQQDLKQLLQELESTDPSGAKAMDASLAWLDRGPWLLLLCLPWLAHWLQRHLLGLGLLTITFWPFADVQANDHWWLWETEEQYAQRLLEEGNAAGAISHFQDPERKAYASYLAGRPGETSELLKDLRDPRSLYNRGTALARERRLPEALEVLEAAVKADPSNQDAVLNRDAVKRALNQQSPQEGKGDPSKSEREQENDPGESSASEGQAAADKPESSQGEAQGKAEHPSQGDESATEAPPSEQERLAKAEESKKEGSAEPQAADAGDTESEDPEANQATEQWLRRIPDDPGGLLRNKFLYQYRKRKSQSGQDAVEPW